MSYSFSNLSPADFEDLVRDLLGKEIGVRFEAFGPGPDQGMDGRHSKSRRRIVLQAKHYFGSTIRALTNAMKGERVAIKKLKPTRYILATSRALSPLNKKELKRVVGPSLKTVGDIFSRDDLAGLLRKFPDVEKSHIKLWLSSTAVLERITYAAAHAFAAITRSEISEKVAVYADNPSFKFGRDILEAEAVLIVSGPPGVGKTTLAEMLSYAYAGDGWELVPIRSLEDGFASISDAKKQIFLFDDFLGKVALDRYSLANKDSDLVRFMRRIKTSSNGRFILTTRAYIFEEARSVSEYLGDERIDFSKYVLDVAVYTRSVRARILYNHLVVSRVPRDFIASLIESSLLSKIIDHKNYNPRVVEWMTDVSKLKKIGPGSYASEFLAALTNPSKLWDVAFRTHIPEKFKHLLFALFFNSEYGAEIHELRISYQILHPSLCGRFGHSFDSKDFEESLRILEGGFINIRSSRVGFVNPSLEDYLASYLVDMDELAEMAKIAKQIHWAKRLWRHGKRLSVGKEKLAEFAREFLPIARLTPIIARWKQVGDNISIVDLGSSERLTLLFELWQTSELAEFLKIAIDVVKKAPGGFAAWSDGMSLIRLLKDLRSEEEKFDDEITEEGEVDEQRSLIHQLANLVADKLVLLFETGMGMDDLEQMCDEIEFSFYESDVIDAAHSAIRAQIANAEAIASEADSESTLDDHIRAIEKLGERAQIDSKEMSAALKIINDRKESIAEGALEEEVVEVTGKSEKKADRFSDSDLMNLFAQLIEKKDNQRTRKVRRKAK